MDKRNFPIQTSFLSQETPVWEVPTAPAQSWEFQKSLNFTGKGWSSKTWNTPPQRPAPVFHQNSLFPMEIPFLNPKSQGLLPHCAAGRRGMLRNYGIMESWTVLGWKETYGSSRSNPMSWEPSTGSTLIHWIKSNKEFPEDAGGEGAGLC